MVHQGNFTLSPSSYCFRLRHTNGTGIAPARVCIQVVLQEFTGDVAASHGIHQPSRCSPVRRPFHWYSPAIGSGIPTIKAGRGGLAGCPANPPRSEICKGKFVWRSQQPCTCDCADQAVTLALHTVQCRVIQVPAAGAADPHSPLPLGE